MILGLDQELFDYLFERKYKPFRSQNARTLYNIFIVEKKAGYLTTLDIQTHLDIIGIDLSKKEINAWLRSLKDAGLITKGLERGKPTTLSYDDKYTYDKWSLTETGLKVSEDLRDLMSDDTNVERHPSTPEAEGLYAASSVTFSTDEGSLPSQYLQSLFLAELRRAGGRMRKYDLMKKLVPGTTELDHALTALVGLGLVEVKRPAETGFLTRVLVNLGLKSESSVVHITERGNQLPD
jgi:hypothetical protein